MTCSSREGCDRERRVKDFCLLFLQLLEEDVSGGGGGGGESERMSSENSARVGSRLRDTVSQL